jgi:DNA invertase Pin-like site-specific DNA recombinase
LYFQKRSFAKGINLLIGYAWISKGDDQSTALQLRALKDMLHLLEKFQLANAGFRSLTENIDTTTQAGRMMMPMIGSFAEFERAMIRERTSAGLAQARAEGRVGGRRPKLNPKQRSEIADYVLSYRKSAAKMARIFGVSQPTVSCIVAKQRAYPEKTL